MALPAANDTHVRGPAEDDGEPDSGVEERVDDEAGEDRAEREEGGVEEKTCSAIVHDDRFTPRFPLHRLGTESGPSRLGVVKTVSNRCQTGQWEAAYNALPHGVRLHGAISPTGERRGERLPAGEEDDTRFFFGDLTTGIATVLIKQGGAVVGKYEIEIAEGQEHTLEHLPLPSVKLTGSVLENKQLVTVGEITVFQRLSSHCVDRLLFSIRARSP